MERFGEALKKIREEKNITLEHIAEVTNINIKYLQALEEEKFRVIPSRSHLGYFVKGYLKVLDADENAFFDRFGHFLNKISFSSKEPLNSCYTKLQYSRYRRHRWLYITLIVLIIVFLLGFYFFVIKNKKWSDLFSLNQSNTLIMKSRLDPVQVAIKKEKSSFGDYQNDCNSLEAVLFAIKFILKNG